MRIKSYFSRTVADAITAARQELGPDALLVNSRKAPVETCHLGEYEVVFAAEAAPGEDHAAENPVRAPGGRLAADFADLKRELEGMRRALARSAFAPAAWMNASPGTADAYAALAAAEVSPELAYDLVQAAEARCARGPRSADAALEFQQAMVDELGARVQVEPALGRGDSAPRIVALVGPPGCGKTTTLVKLAVNYGLAARRPVVLLSMDTYRVAAAEQLRSYAAILGVGFQVLETVTALAQSIEENRGKELIFIDTPGLAAGELEHCPGLARFLSTREDVDIQLVLSSSTKAADLTRMVDGFEIFRPHRLLFTRLDETRSFGPIFNEAARTLKPLSFFTGGQRIPEDLEIASRSRLCQLILAPRPAAERAVA